MFRAVIAAAVAALIGVGAGYEIKKLRSGLPAETPITSRVDYQPSPREVPCPDKATTILIVGQSNAANHGATKARAAPNIVNFYDGRCYEARDPLLGATGDGGSIWTRLDLEGDIVLVPLAVGGSRMAEWSPGGIYHDRIGHAVRQLAEHGLAVDHNLVLQGETEGISGGDAADYQRHATAFLGSLPGRVVMATVSGCDGSDAALRKAQQAARAATGALAGPDFDTYEREFTGCHLTAPELGRAASEWGKLITPSARPA